MSVLDKLRERQEAIIEELKGKDELEKELEQISVQIELAEEYAKEVLEIERADKSKAQEAFFTLAVAVVTGGATKSDLKTYADAQGYELPPAIEDEALEEEASQAAAAGG